MRTLLLIGAVAAHVFIEDLSDVARLRLVVHFREVGEQGRRHYTLFRQNLTQLVLLNVIVGSHAERFPFSLTHL